MRVNRLVQQLHLWLGLLLGAQVLLWMASGLVMSWFHITLVRGETNALADPDPELVVASYANPGGIVSQRDGTTSIRLKTFLGRPVYEASGPAGAALFDAKTAERLSPIARETAVEIATRDFVGAGAVKTVERLSVAPNEYRKALPVWRVTFTDDLETRIYVSPDTGEIEARRNRVWRFYDFFWMLHIMDYKERTDFNNPLLKIAALTGFLFAATGVYLVATTLLRGGYRIRRPRAARTQSDAPS